MRGRRIARRALRALGTGALVALLGVAPAAQAAPGAPPGASSGTPSGPPVGSLFSANEDERGLAVQITRISPQVLTRQDTVRVSGTVRNTGASALESVSLRLAVQSSTSPSLAYLEQYLRGANGDGPVVAQASLAGALPAGRSRAFTIEVARGALPLRSAFGWGPRGVTVRAGAGQASGADHSILVWDSGYAADPTDVGVVVPSGASAGNPRAMAGDTQMLAAQMVGISGVTLAVDPSTLLERASPTASATPQPSASSPSPSPSASGTASPSPSPSASGTASPSPSGTGPTASPTASSTGSASPSPQPGDAGSLDALSAGGQRLGSLSPGQMRRYLFSRARELIVLPQGDADPGLLAATGDRRLLALARQSTHALDDLHASGDARLVTDVAWPSAQAFGLQTLRAFPSATVIAPDGKLRPSAELTYTPSARIQVRRSDGRTVATTRDSTRVLASSDAIATLLGHVPTSAADELDTDQLLRAVSVIITRELPNQSRSVLVALPRGVASRGLAHRTHALLDNRWVRPRSFTQLASAAPATEARDRVVPARVSAGAAEQVAALSESVRRGSLLAEATDDPAAMQESLRVDALAALPASARAQAAQLAPGVAEVGRSVSAQLASVQAGPSATINLINKSARFPVRVTNKLARDVTVVVSLVPSDPRLRADSARTVTIRARREQTVEIPVSAIGSGDITVGVSLRTVTGLLLDGSHSVTVRMRAGWEDTGTAVAGALVVIGFVAGIVRTVRRGTRTQVRMRRRARGAEKG